MYKYHSTSYMWPITWLNEYNLDMRKFKNWKWKIMKIKKKAIKAVRIILCCLKIESGYNFQKQCHGMTSLYRVTHCIDVGNTRDCEWWGFRHGEWTRKVERENSVLLNYTIILEIEKECWSNMLMFKLLQLLIKNKSWKQNFCDFFLLSSRFKKKKKIPAPSLTFSWFGRFVSAETM